MAAVTIFRPAGRVRYTSFGVAVLLHLMALVLLPAMSSPSVPPAKLTVMLSNTAPPAALEAAPAPAAPAKRIERTSAVTPDRRAPLQTAQERMVRVSEAAARATEPAVAQSSTHTAGPPLAAQTAASGPFAPAAAETRAVLSTPSNMGASYLNNPAPAYPELSRRTGEQGQVLLRVLVDINGKPSVVELRASSGSGRLDRAALDAVRHWKFVPATQGGEMIAAWVTVPVVFNLTTPS